MRENLYNWKRFWCPRTGHISLSDRGYMVDPEEELGSLLNPDVRAFQDIANEPCLILLGEPGIGKTTALQMEKKAFENVSKAKGNKTLLIDLRSYSNEDRLIHDLFENASIDKWKISSNHLYIFLDSLDECLLRIDTLATLLIDKLKGYPVDRLFVRIACRTAEWPYVLEQGLKELWGNENVKIFELSPLRRKDVIEAAVANGMNEKAFVTEVERLNVVPLAIRPITLNFLLNLYKKGNQLPPSRLQLYSQGCLLLCDEPNLSRRSSKELKKRLSAEQKMLIGARMAAITVFSNVKSFWTGIDNGNVPEGCIPISTISGGKEEYSGKSIDVTEAAINETLSTGLFTSRGENQMGWSHQTYSEFLSAQYPIKNEMQLKQIMSILTHPDDRCGRLIPQLHSSAAWLAEMSNPVFKEILVREPEILLQNGVTTQDPKDLKALVETLFESIEKTKLYRLFGLHEQAKNLYHPELEHQLREFLFDRSKSIRVRLAAIDIAETYKLETLVNDLTEIALNPDEEMIVRENAAFAISKVGNKKAKIQLKPLLLIKGQNNISDQLKGCALRALWPNNLTAKELFAILTPPKDQNMIDSYDGFVSYDLVPNLSISDIPVALEWIETQVSRMGVLYLFNTLIEQIIIKAWEHIENTTLIQPLAKLLLLLLRNHGGILENHGKQDFANTLKRDDKQRRKILKKMIPYLSPPSYDSTVLIFSSTPIILSKDVPWMVENFRKEKSSQNREAWIQLIIGGAFDWSNRKHVSAILKVQRKSIFFKKHFPLHKLLLAICLPKIFDFYLRFRIWRMKRKHRIPKRIPKKASPHRRIRKHIKAIEQCNSLEWWKLNWDLIYEPDGSQPYNIIEDDLTILPGWKSANSRTKRRIITCARKFLIENDPAIEDCLSLKELTPKKLATLSGYRALRLLLKEAPNMLASLTIDVWKKWSPVTLVYPNPKDDEKHINTMKIAYKHSPNEIIHYLMLVIDKENEESDHIFIIQDVETYWNKQLQEKLLKKVQDAKLKPKNMGHLLSKLLDQEVKGAKELAISYISKHSASDEDERSRAIIAASLLLTHPKIESWDYLWSIIKQHTKFGKSVILTIGSFSDRSLNFDNLRETALAEFYIWLEKQFPLAEDPQHGVTYFESPRDRASNLRNSILDFLKQKGTPESCQAIKEISTEFPEQERYQWALLRAQEIMRRKTWNPIRPVEIIKLAKNKHSRLIGGGEQLLDMLVESLERLEKKLHDETPISFALWNEINENTWRPKSEPEFSDYVKKHLDEDLNKKGIVVNREVQVRRGKGSLRGQLTDIHVDAIPKANNAKTHDSITAIVEVKGCWNDELKNAMKTQLVDRYLKDNKCYYGLYLIGWFYCEQCVDKCKRKKNCSNLNIDQAREVFNKQASELSLGNMVVKSFVMNMSLP